MRILSCFLICCSVLLLGCKPSLKGGDKPGLTYTVSGQVMVTSSYCGGAAPSEEMLEEYRTPKPMSGLKLHIRKGSTNDLKGAIVATTTTDSEGRYSFQLPDGEYCLINDERIKMPNPSQFSSDQYTTYDAECQQDWIMNCDASFKVEGKNASLEPLQFHRRCFVTTLSPCIRYSGPMPP